MIIAHLGESPTIDAEAWIAPDVTICGDVTIAAGVRVLHGARIIAEGGSIAIGNNCIIMENAVVRSSASHPCRIGASVLIGPCAHVVGADVGDEVFIATSATIFHGSRLGHGSEVRVHATVHLKTNLPAGAMVPIGWIACGDPAELFSPDRHEALWAVQKPLDFPRTVYGFDRDTPHLMKRVTERLSERLGAHKDDAIIG